MKEIRLDSRYSNVDTIYHCIDDNCGVITSNGSYVRSTLDEDNETLVSIDFEGGPMLSIGSKIPGINKKKIKNIKVSYYVELE